MKNRIRILCGLSILAAAAACAQTSGSKEGTAAQEDSSVVGVSRAQASANGSWVGIWHATPDGLPAGALTLAADTGELGGTLVLDIISHDGGRTHVIAAEPHVLLNPHVDGNTLSFEIKAIRKGALAPANFTVTRIAPDKAIIQCESCGANGPGITLTKDKYGEAKGVQP